MIAALTSGLLLGLSAGLSPGPLMTLIFAETLRHGTRSGIKVAIAPLITDLPIVALTLLALSRLQHFEMILGVISLTGGIFVAYLGYKSIVIKAQATGDPESAPKSLLKGILVNFLSPNPYLFWFSVGGPLTLASWRENPSHAVVFITVFYFLLIGSKAAIAVLAGKSRAILQGKAYLYTMRILGLALILFAVLLSKRGLELTGIV